MIRWLKRKGIRFWVALFCAICLTLSATTAILQQIEYSKRSEAAKRRAQTEAKEAVREIDSQISIFKQQAHTLADALSSGKISYPRVQETLKHRMRNAHKRGMPLFALGVAFEPGVYSTGNIKTNQIHLSDLASWYCYYDAERQDVILKGKDYNYTQQNTPETSWYTTPVMTKSPLWQEPKFGKTAKKYIAGYSVPFFLPDNPHVVAGVVSANYSIRELKSLMRARNIWEQGYGMIFSEAGKLIYHPNEDLLRMDIADITSAAESENDAEFDLKLIEKLREDLSHPQGMKMYRNGADELWVSVRRIPNTEWELAVIFVKRELKLYRGVAFHFLVLSAMGFFISALYLLLMKRSKKDSGQNTVSDSDIQVRTWFFAVLVTVVFLIAISLLWKIAYELPSPIVQGDHLLKTQQHVEKLKQVYNARLKQLHQNKAVYVPTGVFVKSITFEGPNEVGVTGFVWQKYTNDTGDSISSQHLTTRGVTLLQWGIASAENKYSDTRTHGGIMPESTESSISFSEEDAAYREEDPGTNQVTIGWYFKMNLRQPFDYGRYPFDPQDVWVRLIHSDFNRNVVLVPDLDAYHLSYDSSRPGLDKVDFVLPGWQMTGCHFSVRFNSYNTNFGIDNYIGQTQFPELYYNVSIRRDFMDPFISTITPVVMIIVILFIVLLMTSVNKEDSGIGFSVFAVLGIIAGLLFSVTFWHAGLRQQFPVTGISFFECFYLLCYGLIAYVAINSSLLTGRRQFSLIHSRDNIVPKALFLPMAAGLVLLITLFRLF